MLEFPTVGLAFECRLPRLNHACHLLGGFVRELEAKLVNARATPLLEVLRTGLCLRIEDGVAATHVRHDWMLKAVFVPQGDGMRFTGMTAVGVIGAGRKEAAEDAMLGVKDGQVVVGDHLECSGINPCSEVRNLLRIQVMCRRKFLEAHVQEVLRGDAVRGVQTKIAVEHRA